MHTFSQSKSIFAGMDPTALQTALTNAQQAYLALVSGSKGETFSYTQGDGAKSVTYTRTNMADLTIVIRELQACLGILSSPRRAITPRF